MTLTQLGNKTAIPGRPDEAEIECIPWDGGLVVCRFTAPEFTSLCPITGAPDFARLIIDYSPDKFLIESKSLKLFLGSFRNEGSFHETVVGSIGGRLLAAAAPSWLRICAFYFPRGGIPIDVFWERGAAPACFVPSPDLNCYVGR